MRTMTLDLTKGLADTEQYKAFKFPGGELKLCLKPDFLFYMLASDCEGIHIKTRSNSSDDIMLLLLVVDMIRGYDVNIEVHILYFPYQQDDRKFNEGETFGLKTIIKIMNSMGVSSYHLLDPHSDVTPALLDRPSVKTNSLFIRDTIKKINREDIVIVSPDAGAFKKIYKMCNEIEFNGQILQANKSRNTTTGEIDKINLSLDDTMLGKSFLIVDDICVGGKTFIEIAKILLEKGVVGKMYLAVTHGIFSNGYDELGKYFSKIYTTNSRYTEYASELVEVYNI